MSTNQWSRWLQGGNAPSPQANQNPGAGYNPLTGTQGPKSPPVYRPQLGGDSSSAANGPGFGSLGTSTKGAWYQGVPATAFNEFIGEAGNDWFRREWTGAKGLGVQTENALSRFSPVARYWLAAMGQDDKFNLSQPNAPQRQADLTGKFYERLLGPNNSAIDPKAIMQRVTGSTWNNVETGKNDYIANLLSNPALDAGAQVSNYWSFVNGTVGRLMPPSTMDSYKSLVQREGQLFQDFLAKNPTVSMTFNVWIKQRLGPTGGL